MIKRYSNLEDLAQLEPAWRGIEATKRQRIFQTYDWCRLGWVNCLSKTKSNKLYVLEWTQENVFGRVIFPFFVDEWGTLRFIMDCDSDVSDCIYDQGLNHHIAFKEALEYIVADRGIKQIHLEKMDADSEILNFWGASNMKRPTISPINAYSWIDVMATDDFAKSQPQLRSKDKANIRAIRRKADKYILQVLSYSKGHEYPVVAVNYIASHMRKQGIRDNTFFTGGFADFCRDLYKTGMADIIELVDSEGRVVAINFILKEGRRRLSWVFLYTDAHASTELYVKYFYNLSEGENITFDFGSGGYEYKIGTFRPKMRLLFCFSMPLLRRLEFKNRIKALLIDVKRLIKFCIVKH